MFTYHSNKIWAASVAERMRYQNLEGFCCWSPIWQHNILKINGILAYRRQVMSCNLDQLGQLICSLHHHTEIWQFVFFSFSLIFWNNLIDSISLFKKKTEKLTDWIIFFLQLTEMVRNGKRKMVKKRTNKNDKNRRFREKKIQRFYSFGDYTIEN